MIYGLKKKAFLAAFRETRNVRAACDAAEVGRSSHYRWLETDAAYEEAFDLAKEDAADILEAEATRRAVDGDDIKDRLQQDDGRTAFPHRGSRASLCRFGAVP